MSQQTCKMPPVPPRTIATEHAGLAWWRHLPQAAGQHYPSRVPGQKFSNFEEDLQVRVVSTRAFNLDFLHRVPGPELPQDTQFAFARDQSSPDDHRPEARIPFPNLHLRDDTPMAVHATPSIDAHSSDPVVEDTHG